MSAIPSLGTPAPDDDEGCPRLYDAQRSMFPEVPALVGPVVRRTVDHAEVGRRRMVEKLGELFEGVGVAVLVATRMRHGPLGLKSGEAPLVLHGERVLTRGRLDPEAAIPVGVSAEPHGPVRRRDLVGTVGPRPADHVDDGLEVAAQEHLEGPVTLGGGRRDEGAHTRSVGATRSGSSTRAQCCARGAVDLPRGAEASHGPGRSGRVGLGPTVRLGAPPARMRPPGPATAYGRNVAARQLLHTVLY